VKTTASSGLIEAPISSQQVWEQLCNDRELLERLKVMPEELEALRTCAFLGSLTGKDDMLFILRMIRSGIAADFEVTVDLDDQSSEPEDEIEEPDESSDVLHSAFSLSSVPAPAPESLAAIARVRVPEQLSLFAVIIALTLGMLCYFVPAATGWEQHFWAHLGIIPTQAVAVRAPVGRPSAYRILLMCEAMFVAVAFLLTHWIHRKPVKRFKVRPY
jgi:hypothetical protein